MSPHITHLMGWTVIRTLPADTAAALATEVGTELTAGASVVVEVRAGAEDDPALGETFVRLQRSAADAGTRLVVVCTDAEVRDRLTDAGVSGMGESLDAVLGDEAPTLLEAERGTPAPPLAPGASDATTVAAEDLDAL